MWALACTILFQLRHTSSGYFLGWDSCSWFSEYLISIHFFSILFFLSSLLLPPFLELFIHHLRVLCFLYLPSLRVKQSISGWSHCLCHHVCLCNIFLCFSLDFIKCGHVFCICIVRFRFWFGCGGHCWLGWFTNWFEWTWTNHCMIEWWELYISSFFLG